MDDAERDRVITNLRHQLDVIRAGFSGGLAALIAAHAQSYFPEPHFLFVALLTGALTFAFIIALRAWAGEPLWRSPRIES